MHCAQHLYASHPTSALILYTHNYAFFDALEDGGMNKAEPMGLSPWVFAFTPAYRQEEFVRLREFCPGGTVQNITNREDKIFCCIKSSKIAPVCPLIMKQVKMNGHDEFIILCFDKELNVKC